MRLSLPWRRLSSRLRTGWGGPRRLEAQGFAGVARAPAPRRANDDAGPGAPRASPAHRLCIDAAHMPAVPSSPRPSARWRRSLLLLAFWLLVPVVPFDDPLSTVVLDRDGELLGASIAADGQWRFGVAESVPDKFAAAITCFEDRRFYWHPGVDPLALARAAALNLRRGRVVGGGSTLTMQVVRLSRKGRPRTFVEKAIEATLALRLTLSLSKRQVLGLYAAYAPFGGNTVGLDAAAWRYFGRDARQLSWAETATLAVLPNAPSLVHPGRNRDLLLAKRNRLLDALRDRGAIDAMTAELGKREPLPPAPERLPMLAPHLVARVRAEQRARRFRAGDASPWVRTTLRKPVQERVNEILGRHESALSENGVRNAAALVLDVGDRRGAGLRRQPLAAGHGGARRARGRHPGAPQHRQHPQAAALRVDARGGRGAPRPARARRADPHRLLPPRELRPRLRRGGPGRAGPGSLAQRAGRPHAARARRRPLLRRPAAPRDHDAHAAGRALRPRAHPGRGRGDAVGRHRRLRRRRALGARPDGGGGASGLLPADVLGAIPRRPGRTEVRSERQPRPSPPPPAT